MVKRIRGEDAALRLNLPVSILEGFVEEGMIEPCETVGGTHYFRQDALDRLLHQLHHRIQRASWRDMEDRMEDNERRIAQLEDQMNGLRAKDTKNLL